MLYGWLSKLSHGDRQFFTDSPCWMCQMLQCENTYMVHMVFILTLRAQNTR